MSFGFRGSTPSPVGACLLSYSGSPRCQRCPTLSQDPAPTGVGVLGRRWGCQENKGARPRTVSGSPTSASVPGPTTSEATRAVSQASRRTSGGGTTATRLKGASPPSRRTCRRAGRTPLRTTAITWGRGAGPPGDLRARARHGRGAVLARGTDGAGGRARAGGA